MQELAKEKILEFLNSFVFFEDFTPGEKKKFANLKSSVVYSANGDTIIKEGDFDLSIFILLKGSAAITKSSRPDSVVAKLRKGDIFGEMGYLCKGPRTANVISCGDTYSLKLDGEMIDRLNISLQGKFTSKLIDLLVHRLDNANIQLGKFLR